MILVCPNCSSRFKVKPEAIGEAGRTVRCAKCGHKWHAGPDDLIDPDDLKSLSAAAKVAKKAPAKKAAAKKAAPARAPAPPPDEFEDQGTDAGAADPDEDDDLGAPPPPPMMDGPEPPPIPSEADFNPRRTVPMRRKSPLGAWIGLFLIVLLTAAAAYGFQKQIVAAYPPSMKIYQAVGLHVDLLGHGLEIGAPEAEAIIDANERRLVIKGTVTNTTDETIVIPKLGGILNDGNGAVLHEWVFEADKPEAFPGETISYETEVQSPPRGATSVSVTFKTEEEAKMLMEGGHDMKAADGHAGSSDGHGSTEGHGSTDNQSTDGQSTDGQSTDGHSTTTHQ